MSPQILLRIAALLMLLHAIGHSFGMAGWRKTTDPKKLEVINQMTENKFPFMGQLRSMANYYEGFGHAATISILLIVALLWLISGETANGGTLGVKILWPVAIFCLLLGIDELIYFFPMAAAFSILSGILTLVAIFRF